MEYPVVLPAPGTEDVLTLAEYMDAKPGIGSLHRSREERCHAGLMFRSRKSRQNDPPPLPAFTYHPDPDPVATGSVIRTETECLACGRARGWTYIGPVFGSSPDDDEINEQLCPWCIADGSVASKFDATFVDDRGVPADVPAAVVRELTERTPCFIGWQSERWLYHCDDACAYLGRIGAGDLEQLGDAGQALRQECRELGMTEEDTTEYLRGLHADGDATGYLFKCLHCGMHSAYSDAN